MTVMFTKFQVKNVISALVYVFSIWGHFIFMTCVKTSDATSFVHN